MQDILARLEAMLFAHGEPMPIKKVQKVLGVSDEEYANLIGEFEKGLIAEHRGLALLCAGDRIQLVTKPQFGDLLLSFMKEELSEELTPASVEALSLIAYGGPISRVRLDYIRGVNSSFILRALRMRGLVERAPDPDAQNSFVYDLTPDCMRHMGIARREDLPRYEEFLAMLQSAIAQGFAKPSVAPSVS